MNNEIKTSLVDCNETVEEYIRNTDWRIKANANSTFSASSMIANISGKVIANYWLDSVYSKEAGEAHRNGDIYIHDIDFPGPYCCGHDLQRLLQEGFNGIPGRVNSSAPHHLREALGQMANFLLILQGEWAGAQAFSSFDTLLAPYLFRDQLSYEDTKRAIRNFVYNLNVPSRLGQVCFTNITLDWTVPAPMQENFPLSEDKHLFEGVEDPVLERLAKERGAEDLVSMTYKHFAPEMKILQRAYFEVMTEGDVSGQPFTFPIPTVNITEDFNWDDEAADALFTNAAKVGSPYFQNFIGSQYKRDENGKLTVRDENAASPNDLRSMCCRLQLSKKEIRNNIKKRGGGLFGSDSQTGSIGNCTINLARLGYKHKGDINGLLNDLDHLMDLARDCHERKRKFVQEMLDNGLYPYTKRWIKTLDTFFSTIGINGGNEMIRNFTNDAYDLTDTRGQELMLSVMDHILNRMETYKDETDVLWNLEASPGEAACYKFAREDSKRFPDIIQAGLPGKNYYTNSTQLSVKYTSDLFKVLALQDDLQCKYTGGTVQHLYMEESLSSAQAAKNLVRTVLSNFRLPYISITPTFSVCPKHGYISGGHKYCPLCDEEILEKHIHNND